MVSQRGLMVVVLVVLVVLMMVLMVMPWGPMARQAAAASIPAVANSCAPWKAPEQPVLKEMQACHQAPINRQLGSVCTEIRWLCTNEPIEAWVERLLTSSHTPWFVHPHGKGLVFAQWSNAADASLAIFWEPGHANANGSQAVTQLMMSRMVPMIGASTALNAIVSSDSAGLPQ